MHSQRVGRIEGQVCRLGKEVLQSTSCIFVSVILVSFFEHIYALRKDVAQVSLSPTNMSRVTAGTWLRTVHFITFDNYKGRAIRKHEDEVHAGCQI